MAPCSCETSSHESAILLESWHFLMFLLQVKDRHLELASHFAPHSTVDMPVIGPPILPSENALSFPHGMLKC